MASTTGSHILTENLNILTKSAYCIILSFICPHKENIETPGGLHLLSNDVKCFAQMGQAIADCTSESVS